MSYLPFPDFKRKYPEGRLIGQGGYGKVHVSGDKFVVKTIKTETEFKDLFSSLKELDIYSQVRHPNIVEMKNWTYTPSDGFKIALPLGISLGEAKNKGLITFFQVLGGILSAMEILYDLGVAHSDIKVDNLIYLDGEVKFIDFGLVSPLQTYENAQTITSTNSTLGYLDPAGIISKESNVKIEQYAVAHTLAVLFEDMYPFQYFIDPTSLNSTETTIYQDLSKYPVETRLTIPELFRKYPQLVRTTGTILETPIYSLEDDCDQDLIIKASDLLLHVSANENMTTQTLFLALHLFRRTLPVILPNYSRDEDQKSRFLGLAIVCLSLAGIMTDDPEVDDFKRLYQISGGIYTVENLRDLSLEVLVKLRCIIFTKTPWDYAGNVAEVYWAFFNLSRCNYQPFRMSYRPSSIGSKKFSPKSLLWVVERSLKEKSYKEIIEELSLGDEGIIQPIKEIYEEPLSDFDTIRLAVRGYNNYPDMTEGAYNLGVVLRHDYSLDNPDDVNRLLENLELSEPGKRYSRILREQIIPFQNYDLFKSKKPSSVSRN
jgi:serine/threonine protein kinase